MRRCPRCFAVYDDRTTRCTPCAAPTVSHAGPPAARGRDEGSGPPVPEGEPAPVTTPGEDAAGGDLLLAEADAAWIARAAEALGREGIPARPVASEVHPGIVALYVPERDHPRAIDVVGEALDEPPSLILESPAPPDDGDLEEGAGDYARSPGEPAGDEPSAGPPGAPDPDQAAYCPECGEAYRAGFELCAECAVPLVPMGAAKDS